MNARAHDPLGLQALVDLRDRAVAAPTLQALAFSMANDLHPLLGFRQAVVWARRGEALDLLCVSGLATPDEHSPYLTWLQRAGRWVAAQAAAKEPAWIARAASDPPEDVAEGWAEWWPAGAWCVPVARPDGEPLAFVAFLLDEPPPAPLAALLSGVWPTWAVCWTALARPRRGLWRPSRRAAVAVLAVAGGLLLVPVRQTVLAPAEIVSREAQNISAPIDGVIGQMLVRPNQAVEAGTPLFSLEETTLRNQADVLGKQVAVADAELMAANQRAFDNPQSKGELTLLAGRAQQRRAEMAAVQAQLARTRVLSPRAGVAVYADPNDWLGKPVATGERVMQVADPARPAMRIHLAVADAIALEAGADVTLFLSAYPLDPVRGKVVETSYQATPSDDGVVSYRLLATVDGQPGHARLGLHGTAKLYGERVSLGYYLLRRPLAAVRAWTGW